MVVKKFKKKTMEGKLISVSHSPVPSKAPEELSFPDAMREVLNGRRITRVLWNNNDFCLLKDGWLMIYINGEFRQWLVNDGDMNAIDWKVLSDAN